MWQFALLAAGTLLSAKGQLDAGKADEQLALEEAGQMRYNAGQIQAAGQMSAEEEIRKMELIQSRMLAVAGASGAGALDPTVVKLSSQAAAEGHLAAGMRRYNADSEAYTMLKQADYTERGGKARRKASKIAAAGTLLSGGAQAYGMGGKGSPGGDGTAFTKTSTGWTGP